MLELKVHDGEREVVLQFEHSLLSLSKWEAKHKKPFLTNEQKPTNVLIDYYCDMLLTPDVDKNIVYYLPPDQLKKLYDYMNDPQTASSVPQEGGVRSTEIVTTELIYFWMNELNIDWRAEEWHINRLMMLIQIASYKRRPEEKRNLKQKYTDWRELNEQNKKKFGTKG